MRTHTMQSPTAHGSAVPHECTLSLARDRYDRRREQAWRRGGVASLQSLSHLRHADHPCRGVEEVDRGRAVRHDVPLEPETREKLRLCLRPGLRHGLQRGGGDRGDEPLELHRLDLGARLRLLHLELVPVLHLREFGLARDGEQLLLGLELDAQGLCAELGLLHGAYRFDFARLGASPSLRRRLASALHRRALCLQLEERHALALRLDLIDDPLPLQPPARRLVVALPLVARRRLLRLGRDLDCHVDRLLQRVARGLVDRLNRLDVNVEDGDIVLSNVQLLANLPAPVHSEDARADDASALTVEVVEGGRGDGGAHARADHLADVPHEVGHGEEARRRGLVRLVHLELPVVR
mmetsp:Transcript_20013/g.34080  ORF Transcript_20013/g.34080 Transcript_20013/m.34080 type:complete len:352 (-) Transcript_20013:197-1252(-)